MELLPLMTDEHGKPVGWRLSADWKTVTLPAGKTFRIGPYKFQGWIRRFVGIVNNPLTQISHNVFERIFAFTPYQMWLLGQNRPGPAGDIWLETYDVVNNIYIVQYQPQPPQEFLAGMDIWITAPATPVIGTLGWHIIFVDNKDIFVKKLHEVLGTLKLREVIP